MRALALFVLIALAVCPASASELVAEPEPPAAVVVETKAALQIELLTERIRSITLSIELARRQINDLAAERDRIGRDAASAAGLQWEEYDIDLTQRPPVWRSKR